MCMVSSVIFCLAYRNHDRDLQRRSMYKPWPPPVSRNCFHSGPCCPGSNHCSSYLVSDSAEKNSSETMGSHLQFSLARNCMREWVAQNVCFQLRLGKDRGGASTSPTILPPLLLKTSLVLSPLPLHQSTQHSRAFHWIEDVNGIPYVQRNFWASVKCFTPEVVCRPAWDA